MASPTPPTPSGLSSEDYCYLKCWVALVRVGKQVLTQIFKWGYPNTPTISIKHSLEQLPGYSNSKFKVDFNKDERRKIESGSSIDDFDITLLYTLIQRLCMLIPVTVHPGMTNAVGNPVPKKLSELLQQIKNTRNKFAHPLLGMTDSEMRNHVNEMKTLFECAADEAQIEFKVNPDYIIDLRDKISSQLSQIINSPLPASTISEQLIQIAKEKINILKQEGLRDMRDTYKEIINVSITPWPFAPLRRKIEEVFVTPKIKFLSSYILQNKLTDTESEVDIDDLLITSFIDSSFPGLILLTGQSGIGKSTILKYITSNWLDSTNSSIRNLEQFDLTFYIDCRDTCLTSLHDLFIHLIPKASNLFAEDELKNLIMSLKCLFLLDNIDEVSKRSVSIVNELLSSPSSDLMIIASATQDPGNQIIQKSQKRRPITLIIEGLPENSTEQYIKMLAESLPTLPNDVDINQFSSEILCHENILRHWLTNPEILSHIFFNWCFAPHKDSRCCTLTHILLQSFNIILKKLKDRITSRSIPGVMELSVLHVKLQAFLLELGRIAMATLKNGTSGLGFKNTSQLFVKCQELGLPPNILLSEFLCFRESFDEGILQTSINVSFPSITFQEFCSAYHLYYVIINSNFNVNLEQMIGVNCEHATEATKSRICNILKFLTGLFATNNSEILTKLTPEIIHILQTFCTLSKSSQWFQILEEAQGNKAFTTNVMHILSGNWQVEDYGISSLFVQQLKLSPPDVLSLAAIKNPSSLPHFKTALETCRISKQAITLSLYIYNHFWLDCTDVSDDYLLAVCNGYSTCNLNHFAGRLSSHCFSIIPKSIKRLALQLIPEDIKYLNVILPNLSELQLLSLNLSVTPDSNTSQVFAVNLPKQANTMLSLDLWKITPNNVTWCCNIVKSISSTYTRLALRRTSMDSISTEKFLAGLNADGINVKALVIGSTFKLQPHQKINLISKAKYCIDCSEFKWIDI